MLPSPDEGEEGGKQPSGLQTPPLRRHRRNRALSVCGDDARALGRDLRRSKRRLFLKLAAEQEADQHDDGHNRSLRDLRPPLSSSQDVGDGSVRTLASDATNLTETLVDDRLSSSFSSMALADRH